MDGRPDQPGNTARRSSARTNRGGGSGINSTPRSRTSRNSRGSKNSGVPKTAKKKDNPISSFLQPVQGIVPRVSSTPNPSPGPPLGPQDNGPPPYTACNNNTVREQMGTPGLLRQIITDEAFQTTPISQSAGARLVSNLPSIPHLSGQTSPNELLNFLDIISLHIDNYGSNLINDPNWKQLFQSSYKELLNNLSPAQSSAINLNHPGLMNRCTDLMSRLEEFKMKLTLQCASESSLSSFNGFPSILPNQSAIRNSPDLLSRVSALEQFSAQLNNLLGNFSSLASRVAVLEHVDYQTLLQRIEALEKSSFQSRDNLDRIQNLEVRIVALEAAQEEVKYSFEGVTSTALKYQDSIKSLTRGLALLQTSVSTDISILKQSIDGIASCQAAQTHVPNPVQVPAPVQDLAPFNVHSTQSQVGIPLLTSLEHTVSFAPQVFHPPVTNPVGNSAYNHIPVYTTAAAATSNNLLVTNWLDSHNFSSIQQAFCHPGINASATPLDHGHAAREWLAPHGFCESGTVPRPHPLVSTGREANHIPCHAPIHSPVIDRRSNYSNSSSDESRLSSLNIQGKMLNGQMNGLKSLLSPAPTADLSKSTLLDLHKNRINAVENQTQNLQRSLRDYVRYDGHNVQLCDQVSNVIDSAISWSSEIRSLYQLKEAHKKSQGIKLYESLSKFSNTDMDIFNFLKRFESSTEEFDYPEERAELLFNKFLSSSIQEEMVRYKGDYAEMKRTLLARYGDAKSIMSNLLAPVTKETLPQGTADVSVSLSYYRKLQSGLQKISALLKSQDPSQKDMEIYVTSQEFLFILLNLVPLDAKGEFFKQMNILNEDTLCIRGITPFKLILSSVNEKYEFYDRVSRTQAVVLPKVRSNYDRPRHTRTHNASIAQVSSDTYSESNFESDSDQGCQNLGQVSFQRRSRESKEARPQKPVCKYEFPCILPEHKHPLSDCREFFLKLPKERAEDRKLFKYRHCVLCLQSNSSCSFRKCENMSSIPKVLVCKDCRNEQKDNKTTKIYSVLFCFNTTHFKPPNVELLKALESYIPGFKPSTLKAPISLVSHFQVMSLSKTNEKPKSLTSPVDDKELPPVFNTNTGDMEQSQDIDLIDEVREDSIAVMQTLNINGRLVLTLFDRGANQNLVKGRLAEELGFKSINQRVSAIGVVSGGQIWTDYGSYQTYLGPNPQGKYFELVCQGISEITSSFPKYDLSNINQETIDSGNLPIDTKFPSYVGGDSVGLLVGLKASELEPECVFTLPSGLGVYKSQFCDAFGSHYCYGGPNKYFTSVNKRFNGNVSFIKAYLTQAISQYRNSLYPSILGKLEPELIDSGCGFLRIADPELISSYKSHFSHNTKTTLFNSEIPKRVIHCPGCKGVTCISLNDDCSANSFEDPHRLQSSCTTTLFPLAAKAGKDNVPLVDMTGQ